MIWVYDLYNKLPLVDACSIWLKPQPIDIVVNNNRKHLFKPSSGTICDGQIERHCLVAKLGGLTTIHIREILRKELFARGYCYTMFFLDLSTDVMQNRMVAQLDCTVDDRLNAVASFIWCVARSVRSKQVDFTTLLVV